MTETGNTEIQGLSGSRFSGSATLASHLAALVAKAIRTPSVIRAATVVLATTAGLYQPGVQAQTGQDLTRSELMVSQLVLPQRNLHFGQGSRALNESESPATYLSSFAELDDLHSRTDSVFKRRIRAELDFYGLVGSSFGDEDFLQDSEDWSASVVLRFPVTVLDLYGKFGAIRQTNGSTGFIDSRRFAPNSGTGFRPWSRTEGFASIGAELNLGFFNLFGEYMRIDSETEKQTDTFSTGIKVRF